VRSRLGTGRVGRMGVQLVNEQFHVSNERGSDRKDSNPGNRK